MAIGPTLTTNITLDQTILRGTIIEDKVRLELLNEIRKQGRKARRQFESLVSNWDHKVNFVLDDPQLTRGNAERSIRFPKLGSGFVAFSVHTDDPIFRYLNEGTKVRYRIMERGFRAKTRRNSFTSEAGMGKAANVWNRNPFQAEERRIAPREFTRKWKEQNEPAIRQAIADAVVRGLRKAKLSKKK